MSKTNKRHALALHGGAGAVAGRDYTVTEKHLRELARDCEAMLAAGRSALDVVEIAVAELEDCGLYVAARRRTPPDMSNWTHPLWLAIHVMPGRSPH